MFKVTVIIETPKGSNQKFDYEPEKGFFKLNKILPAGLAFPFDFGFIPDTKGEDGDPLDVIIISEFKTFTGCAADCFIIGCIEAEQTERDGTTVRNDRFIGIPEVSHQFKAVTAITKLPKDILEGLEAFFKNYNSQAGKKFSIIKNVGPKEAAKLIKKTWALK